MKKLFVSESKTYFPFLTGVYFTKGCTKTARHGITRTKQRRNAYGVTRKKAKKCCRKTD